MNIFVYSTQQIYTPHIETELELIQHHLDKKDTVYRIICQGHFPACDMNLQHEYFKCLKCDNNRKFGQKLLDGGVITLPIITEEFIPDYTELYNCQSITELKRVTFQNFDVGLAIASSLISEYRDPDFDVANHIHTIKKYYVGTIRTYLTAIKHINRYTPSVVYLFNGRFAYEKAILRATKYCNVDYIIHERGGDKDHYDLFANDTPHNFNYHVKQLDAYWLKNNPSLEEKAKIGSQFFINRKEGKPKEWISFTKSQTNDLLPENFDKTKTNIVIFNSSLDEYAALDMEKDYHFYSNQEDFIINLIKKFENESNYHFYLRVHPNLSKVNNKQTERISQLNNKNLTLVPATSKISTYKLLDVCDKVITFGSTMGIEAVYWGKPSILVSKSAYDVDDCIYRATSYDEVISYIKSPIRAKNKTYALKFGYYHSVKGFPFKIFKPNTLFQGTYKGVDLAKEEKLFARIIFKLNEVRFIRKLIYEYSLLYKKYKLKLWF